MPVKIILLRPKAFFFRRENGTIGQRSLLRQTSITAITNIGKLTIYARESPQCELIKRKRDPEIKNNIALTM
jgi:hypothetical protein